MQLDDLMYKPGLLDGQRILVTGGGTGLGRVMTEAFQLLGAEVHICGRRGGVVQETARELMDLHGGKVVGHACDVRDSGMVGEMVEQIWTDHGALTGLVNNAAGNFVSRTEDLSMRGFDAVSQIVMRGGFNLTLECGKRWIEAGQKASVLSILVTWIWNGGPFVVPSAMAKSAMNTLTQSLAVEWGPKGIRFNAIAPGLFPTEGMSARLNPQGGEHTTRGGNPMGRTGKMPELANLAVYLMSPQAEYMTGQTIAIDGGQYQATGGNFAFMSQWTDADWQKARENIEAKNKSDREQRTI